MLSGTELAEAKGQIPQGEISACLGNTMLKIQEKQCTQSRVIPGRSSITSHVVRPIVSYVILCAIVMEQ